MKGNSKARIIGTGAYLPEKVLSNKYFEEIVDTSDDWIVSRTGIKERRIAEPDEFTSTMGAKAAKKALIDAGVDSNEIEMIIVATMTPDYISSSTAAIIQKEIKALNAAAFDLQAACSGFLYALSVAKAFIEANMYKSVLVVASEKMSSFVDYTDRSTCVLFGDGAAAAVLTNRGPGLVVQTVSLGSDGSFAELINIPAGGVRYPPSSETIATGMHFFKMAGKEVFKHAVRYMSAAAKNCLSQAGLTEGQMSWLVPHQANMRIMDAIAKGFSVSSERMYKTVHKYGNTSASSIIIALNELLDEHQLSSGENLLLVAFGAGLTWGAAVLTYMEGE